MRTVAMYSRASVGLKVKVAVFERMAASRKVPLGESGEMTKMPSPCCDSTGPRYAWVSMGRWFT